MMRLGIVGLPNAGKSTLFNALTQAGAEVGNYPFTTIDRNVGIVPVPDDRLETLAAIVGSRRVTPAVIEVIDIAGLVRGASQGEGLGNRFLAHIREVDAIVQVVRCHHAPDVGHVEGEVDPARDVAIVETELLLADLDTVERRRAHTARKAKSGERRYLDELAALDRLADALARGTPARQVSADDVPPALRAELFLLTDKPLLFVANADEETVADPQSDQAVQRLREVAERRGAPVIVVSARLEWELGQLPGEEAEALRAELGLTSNPLQRLVREGYRSLGLITFFTANENEARAWTLRRGQTAWDAAGKVHTDMQQGFVRAEVVRVEDLKAAGSLAAAREGGRVRLEGRDYVVADGDVITFRFTT